MAINTSLGTYVKTLGLDQFWQWLQHHTNCILRVGAPDAVLFDHEEFHWQISEIESETWLVQMLRGKRAVAEIVLPVANVTHVNVVEGEDEEWVFELVSQNEEEYLVAGYFCFAHDYDQESESDPSSDPWIN